MSWSILLQLSFLIRPRKQVIGDGLHVRTDQGRAVEISVAVHALNRMLEVGRSNYVRVD
jgi:hypothetical protein